MKQWGSEECPLLWVARRILKDSQWWVATTSMRQNLDDNFADASQRFVGTYPGAGRIRNSELAASGQNAKVASLPEAKAIQNKERPNGIQLIKTHQ